MFRAECGRRWARRQAGVLVLLLSLITLPAWARDAVPGSARTEQPDWAAIGHPAFERLGMDPALSQFVIATTQDRQGFIWFATVGGLARWDGHRFRSFLHDPDDPASLPDNFLLTVFSDQQGVLWVGSNGGGLARYNPASDDFTVITLSADLPGQPTILGLANASAGGLWIGTDRGLFRRDPATGAVQHFTMADGLPSDRVQTVLEAPDGRIWVGTAGGLAKAIAAPDGREQRQGLRFEPIPFGPADGPAAEIRSLLHDTAGRIWVGTRNRGAGLLDPDGLRVTALELERGGLSGTGWVEDIEEVKPGQIWFGTNGTGIISLDVSSGRARPLRHDPAEPFSLIDNTVWCLQFDSSGRLWIGTNQGVSHLQPGKTALSSIRNGSGYATALADTDIRSVASDAAGRVWLGYRTLGVDVLDPVQGRVAAFRPAPIRPERALPQAIVFALSTGPDGVGYAGTDQGLYRLEIASGRAERMEFPGIPPFLQVGTLLREGRWLWIGAANAGLLRLDLDSGRLDPVADMTPGPRQLPGSVINALEAVGDGSVWVGTRKGIARISAEDGVLERYDTATAQISGDLAEGGLFHQQINDMLVDRQGRLWLATGGQGLNVMVGRTLSGQPRFRRIGTRQGLPNDRPNTLTLDDQGRVWVSGDSGLSVINPDRLTATGPVEMQNLGRADGYVARSAWVGAAARSRDGIVLFGGVGALTLADPKLLNADRLPAPSVRLTDIRSGPNREPPGRYLEPKPGDTAGIPLILPASHQSMTVEFSALQYAAAEKVRYRYRLLGFDTEWQTTDASRRTAAYTRLPPDTYRLELQASLDGLNWNGPVTSLSVAVLPAWYQTWWFKVFLLLVAAGAVTLPVRLRTAVLHRRKAELEAQVQARTIELQESHRQLEAIAFLDALTGLPNRRMFSRDVQRLMADARRTGQRFGLVLIDVDRFKQINDTLGHDVGDALLVNIAERLKQGVRDNDTVARLGGDEFALLLAGRELGLEQEGIDTVCARLQEMFQQPVIQGDLPLQAGLSMGVALFPNHGDSADRLYKSADLALYAAKRAGRGTWRWYDDDLRDP
jgi:diguanylate cyclase (GGDEF)-like protein